MLGSGDSAYVPNFCNPSIYDQVVKEVEFLPRDSLTFKIYGKTLTLPRDKQFYGDIDPKGRVPLYRYSKDYIPVINSWGPILKELRDKIEKQIGQHCNHLVANRYLNGNDHISYHHDKERDFVEGSKVLTISLGEPRYLYLKKYDQVEKIMLEPGSLFILGPKTNREWKLLIS